MREGATVCVVSSRITVFVFFICRQDAAVRMCCRSWLCIILFIRNRS